MCATVRDCSTVEPSRQWLTASRADQLESVVGLGQTGGHWREGFTETVSTAKEAWDAMLVETDPHGGVWRVFRG